MAPASNLAAAQTIDPRGRTPRPVPAVFRFWALLTPHVALAPILCFGVTFFHELAHAAAALAVGGEVTEFSCLPSETNLGHIVWEPPHGAGVFDYALVSLAPYLMWALSAGVVLLLAWRPIRLHGSAGSALFVWGYAVPIGDIAGNLLAPRGDLSAPGVDGLIVTATGICAVIIAWGLGYAVQGRLFPNAKLSAAGYLATTCVMGGAWVLAAALGLRVVAA